MWNIAFLKGLHQQESSNVTETLNFSRIYEYVVVKWLGVAVCGKNEAQRWSHGTLPLLLISEGSVNLHSQKIHARKQFLAFHRITFTKDFTIIFHSKSRKIRKIFFHGFHVSHKRWNLKSPSSKFWSWSWMVRKKIHQFSLHWKHYQTFQVWEFEALLNISWRFTSYRDELAIP